MFTIKEGHGVRRLIFATLVVVFSLIWSSAFIAGTVALKDFDPFTLLALRFSLSAIVILPFSLFGKSIFNRAVIKRGLALGVLNNAIYLGLSFSALRSVRPEVVVVVISCAPFVTTLITALLGYEPLSAKKLAGIAIGFFGVVVILGVASTQRPDPWGLTMATAGMVAFACGTVLFRSRSTELPILQTNFWQCVAGAGALIPFAVLWGTPVHMVGAPSVAALLYLVLVVSIGGMTLWLVLIRTSGAATASSYHLLNPFFGVLLAHFVLGRDLHVRDFIGVALIAGGLFLSTAKGRIKS